MMEPCYHGSLSNAENHCYTFTRRINFFILHSTIILVSTQLQLDTFLFISSEECRGG